MSGAGEHREPARDERERYERVASVFAEALDRPTGERAAFVDTVCGDDAVVRRRVLDMLAIDGEDERTFVARASGMAERVLRDAFSTAGATGADAGEPAGDWMPERIGPYEIVRLVGEGGMGSVFEARQDHPKRTVALKTLRDGLRSDALVRRFRREIGLLARLEHPGIARILDAGTAATDRGTVPYFTMEFIRGRPILEAAAAHDLDRRERVAVMAEVCDAVQYAHQRGVIHRDIKPANILLEERAESDTGTRFGPRVRPRVLDFGVARATAGDADDGTLVTLETDPGRIVGTLAAMSPEQVAGRGAEVDTRTDVYALGVVLYELLSGRPPLDVAGASLAEAARIIRDVEPPRLGTVDRELRGDLETIVAMALEKDPARRYASASELGADLRRFLADEPIAARPATTFYQVRKFARRHRAIVAVTLAAAAGLALATAASVRWALLAERSREAEAAATTTALEGEAAMRWLSYRSGLTAAQALVVRDPAEARAQLDAVPQEHRGWGWRHLAQRLGTPLEAIRGIDVAWRKDGTLVALERDGDRWRLVDASTGDELGAWTVADGVRSAALGPRGRWVRTWSGPDVPTRVIDPARGTVLVEIDPDRERLAAVGPAGLRLVLVGRDDRTLRVVRTDDDAGGTAAPPPFTAPEPIEQVDVTPDGGTIVVRTRDAWIALDLDTLQPRAGADGGARDWTPQRAIDLPDEPRFTSGALVDACWSLQRAEIMLLDRTSGETRRVLRGHVSGVVRVVFSSDGRLLLTQGIGATVRVWDVERGLELASLPRGTQGGTLRFSPDGQAAIVIGRERDTRDLWRWQPTASASVLRGHESWIYAVGASHDGRLVASGGWDGAVRVWRADTGVEVARLPVEGTHVKSVGFTDGGRTLVAMLSPRFNEVHVVASWRTDTWERSDLFRADADGGSSFASGRDAFRTLGSPGATLARFNGGAFQANDHAGRLVARAEGGTTVRLHDAATDELRREIDVEGATLTLAFSHDDALLAAATLDGRIVVGRTDDGAVMHTFPAIAPRVFALAFTPDGRRLAVAGNDNVIRLHDVSTGDVLLVLDGHDAYVQALAFAPDGSFLVSGSGDATVRIWRAVGPESNDG